MPRSRASIYDRISHFWGKLSGVTLESNPSGTTITKSGVTATVLSATNINATKVKATQMANAGGTGYTLPHLTTGLLMATGKINNNTASGVTKVDASFFGLTSVNFCLAAIAATNVMNGGVTGLTAIVTAAKPIPAAGVSRVYFRVFTAAGLACKKPVSVQYFAVGV